MTAPLMLIAYASRNGGTAEIARWLGETVAAAGVDVRVRPADSVQDVDEYTAVVLGSGVYEGRWLHAASRFARRHHQALLDVPVWLFSSGPLDPAATERDIPPVRSAARIAELLDAREHVTFGGRLVPGARGFLAHAILSQGKGGDFRDRRQIDAWARRVAHEAVAQPQPL